MTSVRFGVVTDNLDPDNLGRVQVEFLDHGVELILPWIRVLQGFAGAAAGSFCIPEIGEHVVVLEGPGGIPGMVVIGSIYTATTAPLAIAGAVAGDPTARGFVTPGGTHVAVLDKSGEEKIVVKTAEDKVVMTIDAAENTLTLTVDADITITSTNGNVSITCKEATVEADTATVTGSDGVVIDGASSKVEVKGGTVEINGSQGVKILGSKVDIG